MVVRPPLSEGDPATWSAEQIAEYMQHYVLDHDPIMLLNGRVLKTVGGWTSLGKEDFNKWAVADPDYLMETAATPYLMVSTSGGIETRFMATPCAGESCTGLLHQRYGTRGNSKRELLCPYHGEQFIDTYRLARFNKVWARANSNIDSRFSHCRLETWSGDVPEVLDAVRQYAWQEKLQQSLILQSNPGAGKTGLAVSAAFVRARYFGEDVHFTTVAAMMDAFKDWDNAQAYMRKLKSVDVLILDDLGVERDTGFAIERLTELVDRRYARQLPTIITTNLPVWSITASDDSKVPPRGTLEARIGGISGLRLGSRFSERDAYRYIAWEGVDLRRADMRYA